MQNLKLAALALFGAGLLAFGSVTSAGCSSTDDGTGGTAGCTTDDGDGDDDCAGAAGTNGDAGSAGSGANKGVESGTRMAAALNSDTACADCINDLSGTVTDAGGQSSTCTNVAADCDDDQACQDLIAQTDKERTTSSKSPGCWINDAQAALDGAGKQPSATSDAFAVCILFNSTCASKCGNLSTSGCDN